MLHDQYGDVVGQPAQNEGQHHRQDDPYGLVLLLIARVTQRRRKTLLYTDASWKPERSLHRKFPKSQPE